MGRKAYWVSPRQPGRRNIIPILWPRFFCVQNMRGVPPHTTLESSMPTFESSDRSLILMKKANQHSQHLVQLLDKAYLETARGDAIENLSVLIDGLTDYATAHFYFVEHTMSASLHLVEHRKEHKEFMSRVAELQISYYCARKPVALNVLSFLIDWLTYHQLRQDMCLPKKQQTPRELCR